MLDGKGFRFVQRFARDKGDLHFGAATPSIIDQIFNKIGCQPLQPGFDLAFTLGRLWPRGVDLSVKHLIIGDHELGRQALRRQTKGRRAQIAERFSQIRGIKTGCTDLLPATRGAVQQGDGTVAEIEGERWFHGLGSST